jgi:hypothetical protein
MCVRAARVRAQVTRAVAGGRERHKHARGGLFGLGTSPLAVIAAPIARYPRR